MKYGTYLRPDVRPPALPSYMIQGTIYNIMIKKVYLEEIEYYSSSVSPCRQEQLLWIRSKPRPGTLEAVPGVWRVWALAGWWDPAGGGLCFVPSPVNTLPSPSHWSTPASVVLALAPYFTSAKTSLRGLRTVWDQCYFFTNGPIQCFSHFILCWPSIWVKWFWYNLF